MGSRLELKTFDAYARRSGVCVTVLVNACCKENDSRLNTHAICTALALGQGPACFDCFGAALFALCHVYTYTYIYVLCTCKCACTCFFDCCSACHACFTSSSLNRTDHARASPPPHASLCPQASEMTSTTSLVYQPSACCTCGRIWDEMTPCPAAL
jgi:hypothetical protein